VPRVTHGWQACKTRDRALYGQKKTIQRLTPSGRFERELVVVVRKHRKLAPHLEQFISNILF